MLHLCSKVTLRDVLKVEVGIALPLVLVRQSYRLRLSYATAFVLRRIGKGDAKTLAVELLLAQCHDVSPEQINSIGLACILCTRNLRQPRTKMTRGFVWCARFAYIHWLGIASSTC